MNTDTHDSVYRNFALPDVVRDPPACLNPSPAREWHSPICLGQSKSFDDIPDRIHYPDVFALFVDIFSTNPKNVIRQYVRRCSTPRVTQGSLKVTDKRVSHCRRRERVWAKGAYEYPNSWRTIRIYVLPRRTSVVLILVDHVRPIYIQQVLQDRGNNVR